MKIMLKIVLFLVISAALFGGGYYYASNKPKYCVTATCEPSVEVQEIEVDRFSGGPVQKIRGSGDSMHPTFEDGALVYGFSIEPRSGDVISFDSPKFRSGGAVKRLITIRESDNAWWVLGDNRENSHDSGDFGWILPSERSNVLVIKVD